MQHKQLDKQGEKAWKQKQQKSWEAKNVNIKGSRYFGKRLFPCFGSFHWSTKMPAQHSIWLIAGYFSWLNSSEEVIWCSTCSASVGSRRNTPGSTLQKYPWPSTSCTKGESFIAIWSWTTFCWTTRVTSSWQITECAKKASDKETLQVVNNSIFPLFPFY